MPAGFQGSHLEFLFCIFGSTVPRSMLPLLHFCLSYPYYSFTRFICSANLYWTFSLGGLVYALGLKKKKKKSLPRASETCAVEIQYDKWSYCGMHKCCGQHRRQWLTGRTQVSQIRGVRWVGSWRMRRKCGECDRGNSSSQRNRGVKKASLFKRKKSWCT